MSLSAEDGSSTQAATSRGACEARRRNGGAECYRRADKQGKIRCEVAQNATMQDCVEDNRRAHALGNAYSIPRLLGLAAASHPDDAIERRSLRRGRRVVHLRQQLPDHWTGPREQLHGARDVSPDRECQRHRDGGHGEGSGPLPVIGAWPSPQDREAPRRRGFVASDTRSGPAPLV